MASVARPAPRISARAQTRALWLRIHRWMGLGLLAVFLLIGVSGTLLVFRDTVERLFHPARFSAKVGGLRAAPSALLAAGQAALPGGQRATQIQLKTNGGAALVTGEGNGPPILGIGPPRRARVWLDPADGHVLSVSPGGPDFIFIAKAIHGHLLIAGAGRWLMASAGLLLAISAASGLWLWWPGRKNLIRALKWRKPFTRSMNLHRQIGPLVSIGLIAQGLTGIFMALPWLLALFASSAPEKAGAGPPKPSRPAAAPLLSIDAAMAAAVRTADGKTPASIQLPTEASPFWTISFPGGASAKVDDATGIATAKATPPATAAETARDAVAKLHTGGYTILHKLILFATGLAFIMLSGTGLLMWTQARRKART